jgi:hypothetical protein
MEWGRVWGRETGREMTQTMYSHVNKCIKKKKEILVWYKLYPKLFFFDTTACSFDKGSPIKIFFIVEVQREQADW